MKNVYCYMGANKKKDNISPNGRKLISWLKAKKALLPFIIALKEQKKTSLATYLSMKESYEVRQLIDSAFTWANTYEGADFWWNIYCGV